MKFKKYMTVAAAAAILLAVLAGCGTADKTGEGTDQTVKEELTDAGEIYAFRPVDCGIPSQEVYEYPFIGLTVRLSEKMLSKMDSRDVFMYTQEDYAGENEISYAVMRFSAPNQEEKEEEGMSVDIVEWEGALEKIGAVGIYQKDMLPQLDTLTGCDTHKKLGESTDGSYEYYMSTNSAGNQDYIKELEASDITMGEIHELDMSLGYSAFSTDRIDGVENVGSFTTTDVKGETYTESVFADYDLTLVNAFATWCSPCVEEMPELEALRKEYEEKGIKLGVVAVVLDSKTTKGVDEDAVQLAKKLSEKIDGKFPFLIPDDGNMNGRLVGIESVPESFFVDKDGNIVSDPYVGANTKEGWSEIVDKELAELKGED